MKILVVEDEKKAADYMQKGLTEQGYVVDVAYDGEEGLQLALSQTYDLIILDVLMPKLDGWNLIQKIREKDSRTLTLFLTACDTLDDRVRGLDLGADGYLVKPFVFTELLANVRTLLRRVHNRVSSVFKIADLEVDPLQHKAYRAGQRLNLSPKEFMLLELLCRRRNEVLSRNLIADQVWDMNFDSDTNVVDVHIARLRSKVDMPFERKLIHTVRGLGYVLREEE
jgi:two-component system copper resistance phosphate regulon response regulator CusR